MNVYKVNPKDIKESFFIGRSDSFFATVCSEEDAELKLGDESPLCLRLQEYCGEELERIKKQAEEWDVKLVRVEDWDSSFGHTQGVVKKERMVGVHPCGFIVKDGSFAGTYRSYFDYGEYIVSYALTEDYKGEPMLIGENSGFTTSDHDMYYTEKYYLLPKEDSCSGK